MSEAILFPVLFTIWIASILILRFSLHLRQLMFYLLIIFTFSRFQIILPGLGGYLGIRSAIAFTLILSKPEAIIKTIKISFSNRLFRMSLFWLSYLCLSILILNFSPKLLFEATGNMILITLTVHFGLMNDIRRSLTRICVVFVCSLIPAIAMFHPAIKDILDPIGFAPYTFHQECGLNGLTALPFVLLAIHHSRKKYTKLFFFLIISAISGFVLLSGARAPMVVFVIVILLWKRTVRWILSVGILGLFCVLIAAPLMQMSQQQERSIERMIRVIENISERRADQDEDISFRQENYQYAMKGFTENPIIGIGYNNWYNYYSQESGILGFRLALHSDWMNLILETGILGTILFLMLIREASRDCPIKIGISFLRNLHYSLILAVYSLLAVGILHNFFLYRRDLYFLIGMIIATKISISQTHDDNILSIDYTYRR